jgi:hypothetical protein
MKIATALRIRNAEKSKLEVTRLLARVVATAMFAFWGASFLEHMWEWFLVPLPNVPPAYVWVNQLLHFVLLAGLLIGFKSELLGGGIVIVASVLFLTDKALEFIPVSILPALLYLYCWHLEAETRQKSCLRDCFYRHD